jgi:hypothetical protein
MAGAGGGPDPGDINERLDEIAAELASEALFKEPSAAERARAAGVPPAWPAKRKGAKLRRPAQPLRPVIPATAGRRPRAGSGRSLLLALMIIFVIVGGSTGLHSLLQHRQPGPSPTPPAARASASTPPPAITAADPFAASPAADYADGAAGIVLPAARATGEFSAAEVAGAYLTVRKILIAANLDWPTLRGGTPAALEGLLVRQQRTWFTANLDKTGLTKAGAYRTSRVWVASFFPGSSAFAGDIVKVRGLPIRTAQAKYSGRTTLRITTDYLFVYAVESPGVPSSLVRVVARSEATVYFAQWDDPGGSLEPWIAGIQTSYAGAQCGSTDGFIHPAFPQVGPGKVRPSGAPVDPYDLNAPQVTKGCQLTTGT